MHLPLPDYHMHTTLCNHASGKMEEYVERAIELGLAEIGFSEHMPVMPEPHLCLSYDNLPFYIHRVKTLQDKYSGRIAIRLGGEIDMVPERYDEIETIIRTYDFDFIIGSIHYLGDWPFDQVQYRDRFEREDLYEIYRRFFETVINASKSGLYDIAGHIDNLKRMGYHPPEDVKDFYYRAAESFRDMNVAVEINTSGYDYPAGETYPSLEYLKILREYDIPVTLGSDSHKPSHVGRHFDTAIGVLRAAGYDEVAFYNKRKRIMRPLNPLNNG